MLEINKLPIMPQISTSLPKAQIKELKELQRKGDSFSKTLADLLKLAVVFKKNNIGKLVARYGDQMIEDIGVDYLLKFQNQDENERLDKYLQNISEYDWQEWREIVKKS